MRQTTQIRDISLPDSKKLHKLFFAAFAKDFAYFSRAYQKSVHRQNTLAKLALGTLHPRRQYLGLYEHNRLVGYSLCGLDNSGGAFLYWLYVSEPLRGKKLGAELLAQSESRLAKRNVDTITLLTHNQKNFYEKHGYRVAGSEPSDFTGVTLQLMSKTLL